MSADSMRAMDQETRRTIGMLCVLRRRLNRAETGVDGAGFPFDSKGNLSMNPESRERFLGTAEKEETESWHSAAADLYSGNWEDLPERLRHLALAGRNREALKLASKYRFKIADSGSADLLETVRILLGTAEDTELSMCAALLAVRLGNTGAAWEILGNAEENDRTEAMKAETLLAEGKTEEALGTALNCYSTDCDTPLTLGKCMNAAGRHSEALVYIRAARRRMMESGCLFRLEEAAEEEAAANRALGRPERAGALEMSAEASKPDLRIRRWCWP
jgi:tetratricopeptide (TPR) repeat protein